MAKMGVHGQILCRDARMRFGPFPYPLTHLNGRLTSISSRSRSTR